MSNCGIYAIKNLINGKIYVGKSIDIKKRLKEHKTSLAQNRHYNIYLQNSWNKYGQKNFIFEILEECLETEINKKEIYYIEEYKKITYVYNLRDGGEGGSHSEESLIKMSESSKGKKHSEETKKKISEAIKGRISWNKGLHTSDETRKKISEAGKGRIVSEETRQKISKANKGQTPNYGMLGKKHSEEAKKKMSETRNLRNLVEEMPINLTFKDRHHTEEAKRKIGEANKGRIKNEETRRKIGDGNKGKFVSEETRDKLRKSSSGRVYSEETKRKLSEATSKYWENKRKQITGSEYEQNIIDISTP